MYNRNSNSEFSLSALSTLVLGFMTLFGLLLFLGLMLFGASLQACVGTIIVTLLLGVGWLVVRAT